MESSLSLFLNIAFQPPAVKCETKIWHPNISEDGFVCLSILRQNSYDGLGWAPTRRLKDVVWGLNSLFTVVNFCRIYFGYKLLFQDLLNFEDPLNIEASELYSHNPGAFQAKVRHYVQQYARR